MNKELLVKVWIFLILITAILFYFIATNSILYPITFGIYTRLFFILHASVLVLAIPVSIIGIRKSVRFSKILLLLVPVFLILAPVIFITINQGDFATATKEQVISICNAQAQMTCLSKDISSLPPTWNAKTIRSQGNVISSCLELTNCSTCQECGFEPS